MDTEHCFSSADVGRLYPDFAELCLLLKQHGPAELVVAVSREHTVRVTSIVDSLVRKHLDPDAEAALARRRARAAVEALA